MGSTREDQSGIEHLSFVLNLIFITFLIFLMLFTSKTAIDIQDKVNNICLQKISVDKELHKNEWQMNQIELIRKALSSDPNLQQSTSKTRSYDIPEGPGFKTLLYKGNTTHL